MIGRNYSYGIERDEEALERNDLDHTKWTNPLESRHVTQCRTNAWVSELDNSQTTERPVATDLLCLRPWKGNRGEYLICLTGRLMRR